MQIFQRQVSFSKAIISIILLMGMLPFIVIAPIYGKYEYQQILENLMWKEAAYNRELEKDIEKIIGRYQTLLKNMADPIGYALNNENDHDLINGLLRGILKREKAIHGLFVISSTGEQISLLDRAVNINLSPAKSSITENKWRGSHWSESADLNNNPEIIVPLHGREYIGPVISHEGLSMFVIAVPVGNINQPTAVLLAQIELQILWEMRAGNDEGAASTTSYLIDHRGRLLVPYKNVGQSGDIITHLPIVRASLMANYDWDSNFKYKSIDGKDVYGSITNIPATNWSVISDVPAHIVLSTIRRNLFTVFTLIFSFMIIITFFGLIIARRVLTPLTHLDSAISEFTKSTDKVPVIPRSNIMEFNHLATAFDRMVAERFRIDQELRRSQRYLSLHRKQTPLAVIQLDMDFKVVDWNPSAERVFGSKKNDVMNKCITDCIESKVLREAVDAGFVTQAPKACDSFGSVDNVIIKNGEIKCEWINTILNDEDDNSVGVILLARDVTSQYETQRLLERKEQEQSLILDNMVNGVVESDCRGNIIIFNKAAQDMFQYTAEEVIGNNVTLLMPEVDRIKHDEYIYANQKTKKFKVLGQLRELLGRRKNGDTFPLQLSLAEVPSSNGENSNFIASCVDLTDQKQQEEQQRRSQKMEALGKLTGGIAHDYNNMLNVIIGFSTILKRKLAGNEELIESVDEIYNAGQRGAILTKKMLSFSRNKESSSINVNISALVQGEKNMLETTLTPRIKLSLRLEDDLWNVWLDDGELEDAILNISINAMHAMPDGGELLIETKNIQLNRDEASLYDIYPGNYVMLTITDTGSGMSADVKQKIFDPFFSTKGENGTGLGLSQVYGFVVQSGGAIKVDSRLGSGTRLLLYFPRSMAGSEPINNNVPAVLYDTGEGETILAVDDEPSLVYLARDILEDAGYRVLTAENAKQALCILNENEVDLLLTDIIMPEMDGYQLASEVKKKFPSVKVQLISGFTGDHDPGLVDAEIQLQLLKKPYTPDELLRCIHDRLHVATNAS